MANVESFYHLNRSFFESPMQRGGVSLFQIGRLYCKSGAVVPLHIHGDYFELTIVTDGKGIITTNGFPVEVSKGDIYLSLPCESHEIVSDTATPLKYDFFAFLCVEEKKREEFWYIAENYYAANSRIIHSERIANLVGNAIAEVNSSKDYSDELLECVFKEIMIYVIRGFNKLKPEKHNRNVTEAEILCYKLMNYIDTHIYSLKTLKELEAFTDYSYGYLSAVFRKTTGNSLSEYYRERKLEAARLLLIEGRLKTIEIAEMLGYSSVYAFSKAFTNRFLTSPRNYKKNYT